MVASEALYTTILDYLSPMAACLSRTVHRSRGLPYYTHEWSMLRQFRQMRMAGARQRTHNVTDEKLPRAKRFSDSESKSNELSCWAFKNDHQIQHFFCSEAYFAFNRVWPEMHVRSFPPSAFSSSGDCLVAQECRKGGLANDWEIRGENNETPLNSVVERVGKVHSEKVQITANKAVGVKAKNSEEEFHSFEMLATSKRPVIQKPCSFPRGKKAEELLSCCSTWNP